MTFSVPLFVIDPHSITDVDPYDEVEMGLGEVRTRSIGSLANKRAKGTWRINAADVQAFVDWYETDLVGGTLAFSVDTMNYGAGTASYSAIIVGDPPYRAKPLDENDLWFDIELELLLRPEVTPITIPSGGGGDPCHRDIYFLDNFNTVIDLNDGRTPEIVPTGFTSWTTDDVNDGKVFLGNVTLEATSVSSASWSPALDLSDGFSLIFDYSCLELTSIDVIIRGSGADNYLKITLDPLVLWIYDGPTSIGITTWPGFAAGRITLHVGQLITFLNVGYVSYFRTVPPIGDMTNFDGQVTSIEISGLGQSTKFDRIQLYRNDCEVPSDVYGAAYVASPVLLRDDFTGSGSIVGRAADGTGQVWVNEAALFGSFPAGSLVAGDVAQLAPTATVFGVFAPLAAPLADGYVEARCISSGATVFPQTTVGMRWVEGVTLSASSGVRFDTWRVTAGTVTVNVWSDPSDTHLNDAPGDAQYSVADEGDYVVRLECEGDAVRLLIDGVLVWSGTQTEAAAGGDILMAVAIGTAGHADQATIDYIEAGVL